MSGEETLKLTDKTALEILKIYRKKIYKILKIMQCKIRNTVTCKTMQNKIYKMYKSCK